MGDGGQLFTVHHRAGRVTRIADEQHLSARGHRGLDLRRGQHKVVRCIGRYIDYRAPCQDHIGSIRYEAGLRNEHFIPCVDQRLHRQVHRLADADRNQHLRLRIIGGRVIAFRQHPGHGRAQVQHPCIGGIRRVSLAQTVSAGVENRRRRNEVRLADAQADHVVHGCSKIEIAPNRRGRHTPHATAQSALQGAFQSGRLSRCFVSRR